MNEFGSKICHICYSAQEPASRFCDNCGNRFVIEIAPGGDVFLETKTFMRRQVRETRPLFWASIIVVGTLSVFGFAQAGVFNAEFGGTALSGLGQATQLVSRELPQKQRSDITDTTAEVKPATASTDPLMELNGSVFDMKQEAASSEPAPKRRTLVKAAKQDPALETIATTAAPTTDTNRPAETSTNEPFEPVKKPYAAEAPRKYIRGPLGGCYYMTAGGSKRYVDRSICAQ